MFSSLGGIESTPPSELVVRLLSTLAVAEHKLTEATERADRAESESLIDHLTGLFNRRGWIRSLTTEDDRCRRFGLAASIAVIDLDDLKLVNDRDGHPAGDDLLKRAAQVIVSQTRGHDIVARLGGDEFGLMAVGCNEAAAKDLAIRLSNTMRAEEINASIGMASRSADVDLRQAWESADRAMYRSKRDRKPDATISERPPPDAEISREPERSSQRSS